MQRRIRNATVSLAALAFGLALLLSPAGSQVPQTAPRPADPPAAIEISVKPIESFNPSDPNQRRFGALEFRGGLELSSPNKHFGGLSALRMMPDGAQFLSLTDKGWWLRGRIVYSGTRPVGIAEAEMAPMLGADGRPLAARGWFDTESLAYDDGTLYVGIERVNRIVRFDYGRFGLLARGQPVAVPPGVSKLPYNKGLECLASAPKGQPGGGALIGISERGLDADRNIKGFLIGGPAPGEFSLARRDDFDVSDCAILPSGDLLVLERRFSWVSGIVVRLRRIALAALAPGAVVDGPVLLLADMGYQIDNLEGLGIHRTPGGEVVLTMVSDDNFSVLQRTILLQFTLVGE